MEEKPTFEQTQGEDEERKKDELWEDSRRRIVSESVAFWNGNPYAKPVQRAGLVVFENSSTLAGIFGEQQFRGESS